MAGLYQVYPEMSRFSRGILFFGLASRGVSRHEHDATLCDMMATLMSFPLAAFFLLSPSSGGTQSTDRPERPDPRGLSVHRDDVYKERRISARRFERTRKRYFRRWVEYDRQAGISKLPYTIEVFGLPWGTVIAAFVAKQDRDGARLVPRGKTPNLFRGDPVSHVASFGSELSVVRQERTVTFIFPKVVHRKFTNDVKLGAEEFDLEPLLEPGTWEAYGIVLHARHGRLWIVPYAEDGSVRHDLPAYEILYGSGHEDDSQRVRRLRIR